MNDVNCSSYHEFTLKPDAKQLALLEEMMEGPVFLQRLLAMHGDRIETINQATEFLDKNWKRLVPYMFGRNTTQTPRAMEQLILRLANADLKTFSLDFAAGCALTATQSVLLPIPELSALDVENHASLARARQGMKHRGSFTLLHSYSTYAVGIEFEKITLPQMRIAATAKRTKVHSTRIQSPTKPIPSRLKINAPQRKVGTSAQEFLASFNNRVTAHLKEQLAVSRAFTTTRFGDLSGWGVSGGLPSLPKRR